MQYLLKVNRLGGNAVVLALALGDDKTTSFDVSVKDYISQSALPVSSSSSTADLTGALKETFISTPRLGDLISLFRINVIQKLAPGLRKEGYEDRSSTTQQQQQQERGREQTQTRRYRDPLREDDPLAQPARPYPSHDPLAVPPSRRPIPGDLVPPGFENELEINEPPRGFALPGFGGGGHPLSIGERDLYPPGLGPNDPLRGTLGPNRGGAGSGGMHPTLGDPLFGGIGGVGYYDPQAPPGSRYDPVGPGDGPPFGSHGSPFGRRGGGGFGGFGGGFGGMGGFGGGDII